MVTKVLKKIGIISLISIMGTFGAISCSSGNGAQSSITSSSKNEKKIGIIQIVEHEALDSAREGFITALKDKGYKDGDNIKIDYQNAQGDNNNLNTIAKGFQSDKKDLILAIATPSAQAVYNVIKDKPIFITAVTDPVAAGLVKSLEEPGTNVSGTSDIAPIDKQLKLLKDLFPEAKNVGVLYNTSEANSEATLKVLKSVGEELGLSIISQGVTNTNEVSDALDSILDKIDVLYVPTDNTIASSIALVTKKATDKSVSVIGSESAHVEGGALATEGIDYYELGYQTGLMAVKALEGEDVSKMPIETLKDTKLIINETVAEKLNLTINKEIYDKAEKIK